MADKQKLLSQCLFFSFLSCTPKQDFRIFVALNRNENR